MSIMSYVVRNYLSGRSIATNSLLLMSLFLLVVSSSSSSSVVQLGGQLAGTTLEYRINKNDERTFESCCDTITMVYTVPQITWISIGFSTNGGNMIGSDAVVGLPSTNQVLKYYMSSYENSGVVPMPESQQTLIDTSIVQDSDSGTTTMNFTKILDETNVVADEIPLMIGTNMFMGACGFSNFFGYHQARESFQLTLLEPVIVDDDIVEIDVDVVDTTVIEIVETRKRTLWKVHGWFAAIAWGVLAPISIGSAMLRQWFPKEPVGLWYKTHLYVNYAVVGMTIISFAVAVVAIQQENASHFTAEPFPHKLIGLIVFLFVLIQAVGGEFRPNTPSSKGESKTKIRTTWEIGHRVLGISLLATSLYQIDSGIRIYQYLFLDSRSMNLIGIYWGITGTLLLSITIGYVMIRMGNVTRDKNENGSAAAAADEIDDNKAVPNSNQGGHSDDDDGDQLEQGKLNVSNGSSTNGTTSNGNSNSSCTQEESP